MNDYKHFTLVVSSAPVNVDAVAPGLAERMVDNPVALKAVSEGLRQRRGQSDVRALGLAEAVVKWRE